MKSSGLRAQGTEEEAQGAGHRAQGKVTGRASLASLASLAGRVICSRSAGCVARAGCVVNALTNNC